MAIFQISIVDRYKMQGCDPCETLINLDWLEKDFEVLQHFKWWAQFLKYHSLLHSILYVCSYWPLTCLNTAVS